MFGATETITIWNNYADPFTKTDIWVRHVVGGCSWELDIVKSMSGSAANLSSTFSVLIDQNLLYLKRAEWLKLSVADKQKYFTVNVGDLVARGEHDIEIGLTAPNTETQVKLSLMPDVFNVKAFTDETEEYKRGKHYELEGV